MQILPSRVFPVNSGVARGEAVSERRCVGFEICKILRDLLALARLGIIDLVVELDEFSGLESAGVESCRVQARLHELTTVSQRACSFIKSLISLCSFYRAILGMDPCKEFFEKRFPPDVSVDGYYEIETLLHDVCHVEETCNELHVRCGLFPQEFVRLLFYFYLEVR